MLDIDRDRLITDRILRRFNKHFDRGDGCWNWKGRNKEGYGIFMLDGQVLRAHRVAWVICYGPIPEGLCVCHKCDNPRCVRPSHLWLGTQHDNQDDKLNKGRQARGARVLSYARRQQLV